jgi:WhiB family transcriptional regulator, redox-sensing transcriptional regulator
VITTFLPPDAPPLPCAGQWDLFFSPDDEGEVEAAARAAAARRVCAGCSLARACFAWAMEHGEAGTWAGTTEHERYLIRRRRIDRARHAARREAAA